MAAANRISPALFPVFLSVGEARLQSIDTIARMTMTFFRDHGPLLVKECTMKRFFLLPCVTLLILLGCGGSRPAQAGTIVLDIKALIDGRDDLIIQGDTLQWHHFDFAAVGRWEGFNVPTLISTTVDGTPIMSDYAWTPDWPLPPPNEIRFEAYSSVFTGLQPGIPSQVTSVSVATEQDVRTLISIVQYPSAANTYTTIVEFNDDPFPGAAAAWGRITFTTSGVPEPSSLFLLGMGLFGIAGYAWRRRYVSSVWRMAPSRGSPATSR